MNPPIKIHVGRALVGLQCPRPDLLRGTRCKTKTRNVSRWLNGLSHGVAPDAGQTLPRSNHVPGLWELNGAGNPLTGQPSVGTKKSRAPADGLAKEVRGMATYRDSRYQ